VATFFANPLDEVARTRGERVEPRLELQRLPEDLVIVLGGDGYMLETIGRLGPSKTYLGLNCGRIGFLLNDEEDDERFIQAVHNRAWLSTSFPRLALQTEAPDGSLATELALNDVYLERSTGQSAHIRIALNGVQVVERLVCDGVIIATALGSTAYSYSAGGAATDPRVRCLHVTPICPHTPKLQPITLPLDSRVELWCLDSHRRPVRASADGRDCLEAIKATITDADSDVTLAFIEGHDFTAALIRKILLT
jgi:NAD+ kinase